ncbi:MAG: DUF1559 domain-containing protein [Planctomycetota bacterium]
MSTNPGSSPQQPDTNPELAEAGMSPPLGTGSTRSSRWPVYAWSCVAILIVGLIAVPLARRMRFVACETVFRGQVKQLVLAVNQYEERYHCFPPAYTVDVAGKRLHSWRTLILPYLGQEALYRQIRLNEPWDSPHNKQLHNQRPTIYGHAYVSDTVPGEAHILALVGRETIWPEQYSAEISDIRDGTSNSIMLMEYSQSEINWMEPRDLTRADVRIKVFPVGAPESTGAFRSVMIGMADGITRSVGPEIDRQVLSSICSINMGTPLPGVDWPPLPVDSMAELPAAKPAAEYPGSTVFPYLGAKIEGPKNVVYCATFQIAWDQLRDVVKADPQFDSKSEFVDELNASRFPLQDLDPTSYVATGGRMDDHTLGLLDGVLKQKFPKHERLPLNAPTDGFIAYCYLLKQLSFRVNFERFGVPMVFHTGEQTEKVEAFGIDSLGDVGHRLEEILEQVEILDHVSDSDFILQLKTRDRLDEMILAKIPPGKNLRETLATVEKRIVTPAANGFRKKLGGGDKLMIPVLQMSVKRDYPELTGQAIENGDAKGNRLIQAVQIIKFRLDETGVIIESEAAIIGENGHSGVERDYDSSKPRQLIFDRPFLLVFRETKAKAPYLVVWVAHQELMERSRK